MSIIRSATCNDLNRVVQIVRDAIQYMSNHGINQWDNVYPDKATLKSDIRNHQMYVIETDANVAGFITLNEEQEPEYDNVAWRYQGKALIVHRLTIHPDYQRTGLASQLMDYAEDLAAAEGYDSLRLDAFTENPAACTLYENRGYLKSGQVTFRKGPFFCYEKLIEFDRS